MSTNPSHDPGSIALDARRVLEAARADTHVAAFALRVVRHELDRFESDIAALEAGGAARSTHLHARVAAGAHVAEARAGILHFASDVRDDVKIAYPDDSTLQHDFTVGMTVGSSSTPEVKQLALTLIEAAHAHADAARKVGLDAHGVHDLEHMVHALEATDAAHVLAATGRHDNSTATDSLAHKVSHEAAHLRLIARRVFKTDPSKLDRYVSTLPRRAVTPRAPKPAPAK